MGHSATLARLTAIFAVLILVVAAGRADGGKDLLLNPGAEQGKGDLPSVWFAAQVPAEGLRMWRASDQAHSGKACLAISNQHHYKQAVCNNWAQTVQEVPVGEAVQLSAYIKTQDADAVNVCVQCWDQGGEKMLAFGSTPVFRGDQKEWLLVRTVPITVPPKTAVIIVRAVLTGRGKAWFDDLSLVVVDRLTPVSADAEAATDALAKIISGRIVRSIPVTKDCMILAYLPQWKHGNVDNIAVANNGGGVRTALAWEGSAISPVEAQQPGRQFIMALYSRETTAKPPATRLQVHELLADWPERTSWQTQPRFADKPAASFELVPGQGWKLFDITPLIRDPAKAGRKSHGVILRFVEEDRSGKERNWSGYAFVSREGIGEWEEFRPRLLVVEAARKAPSE